MATRHKAAASLNLEIAARFAVRAVGRGCVPVRSKLPNANTVSGPRVGPMALRTAATSIGRALAGCRLLLLVAVATRPWESCARDTFMRFVKEELMGSDREGARVWQGQLD